MSNTTSILAGKSILAVDDETDVLESIEDILDMATVDTAVDYNTASDKLKRNSYDLAILDIMGVDGLRLLDESVAKGIPTVMLTAHAVNPESLMASIRKGAISYLPKESLADLDSLLNELFDAYKKGEAPWTLLFKKLGSYFDERFGEGWQEKDKEFWSECSRTYQIGKGIQERLKHDGRVKRMF